MSCFDFPQGEIFKCTWQYLNDQRDATIERKVNYVQKLPLSIWHLHTSSCPPTEKVSMNWFLISSSISVLQLTPLPPEGSEEVNAEEYVEEVHPCHPEEGQGELNPFTKLGGVSDELVSDEKVGEEPRREEGDPVQGPLDPHHPAVRVSDSGHPPDLPHVEKYRMKLQKEDLSMNSGNSK